MKRKSISFESGNLRHIQTGATTLCGKLLINKVYYSEAMPANCYGCLCNARDVFNSISEIELNKQISKHICWCATHRS